MDFCIFLVVSRQMRIWLSHSLFYSIISFKNELTMSYVICHNVENVTSVKLEILDTDSLCLYANWNAFGNDSINLYNTLELLRGQYIVMDGSVRRIAVYFKRWTYCLLVLVLLLISVGWEYTSECVVLCIHN